MGPLQGRDATLLNNLSGYISNPILQPEVSKLALQHAPANHHGQRLLMEIQPWLTKLGEEGQGGIDALNVMKQPSQRNQPVLSQQPKLVNANSYAIGRSIIAFMNKVENSNQP